MNPALLKTNAISVDAKERALKYSKLLDTPMGAYTSNSKGYQHARNKIADFINQRDGTTDSEAKNIYITNGAGEGVKLMFNMLIRGGNDGVMIPIP